MPFCIALLLSPLALRLFSLESQKDALTDKKISRVLRRNSESMEKIAGLWVGIGLSADDVRIDWSVGWSVYHPSMGLSMHPLVVAKHAAAIELSTGTYLTMMDNIQTRTMLDVVRHDSINTTLTPCMISKVTLCGLLHYLWHCVLIQGQNRKRGLVPPRVIGSTPGQLQGSCNPFFYHS